MPIRNAGVGLEKRLKSILSQSHQDFELIISDNNSEDSTSEICQKFSNIDKRIRYYRQSKNIGIHKSAIKLNKIPYFWSLRFPI